MKTVGLEQATLDACVEEAQGDRVVITRAGQPVAMVIGVQGLDEEQLELGSNGKFWQMIRERRDETTISRAELERRIATKEQ